MEIEACPPPNWGQLVEVNKFSWLVSKYCEMAQSSYPSPTECLVRPTDVEEASTGGPEDYCDTPRSDRDPFFGSDELGLNESFDDAALHFMRLLPWDDVSTSYQI